MQRHHDRIDPRKLLYLAAVIEAGSLSKAARVLGLSQPALSQSMDQLEAEIGDRVLHRGPAGVTPTSCGEMVYHYARSIRDELSLAKRHLSGTKNEGAGLIRFGCLPSLAGSIIPEAISRWRAACGDQQLRVIERVQIDLLSGLLRREFDFTIGVTDFYDLLDGLMQRVLYREQLRIIARHGHPLSDLDAITLDDLAAYPWISPPAGGHSTLMDDLLASARRLPHRNNTICSSATLLKSLVESSDHLALLPKHAVHHEMAARRLVLLPILLPQLDRSIAVFFREGYQMTDAAAALVRQVQTVGHEVSQIAPPAGP